MDPDVRDRVRSVPGHPDVTVIDLMNERFVRADLSGLDVAGWSCHGSVFENCNFRNARVRDAHFGNSRFVDCTFDGSTLRAPAPGAVRFERCSFIDVQLLEWLAFAVEFVDCVFSGLAGGCVFNGAVPDHYRAAAGRETNAFTGNDFTNMTFRDVAFRTGVDLTLQKLPSGSGYLFFPRATEVAAKVRTRAAGLAAGEPRDALLILAQRLERQAREGQIQLLWKVPKKLDSAKRAAWSLIAEYAA